MLKKITALLLTFVIFTGIFVNVGNISVLATAAGTGSYIIATESDPLRIRLSSSKESKELGSIRKGALVSVTEVSSNWGKVTYNGITGWIDLNYCTKYTQPTGDIYARLNALRVKFPHGKYWNHQPYAGSKYIDEDMVTSTPCPQNSNHRHLNTNYCNGQCDGFARKIGKDLFGTSTYDSNHWQTLHSLDNLCVGDLIRFGGWHTVVVIGYVSSGVVKIVDCNWNCNCNIRWDANYEIGRYAKEYGNNYYVLHEKSNYNYIKGGSSATTTTTKVTTTTTTKTTASTRPTTVTTTTAQPTTAATLAATKSFSISATSLMLGAESTYTVTATADGKTVKPEWSSANTNIAVVDANGKISAVSAGKVNVTAKYNGKTATCIVTVKRSKIARLGGSSRIDTACIVANSGWGSTGAANIILANGYSYADALAGVPLARALNAPILLTAGDEKLESCVSTRIASLKAKNIYILGGTNVVSSDIENTLKSNGLVVTRLAGSTRYGTSAAIAEQMRRINGGIPSEIFFVNGYNFPDAIAVSSAAAVSDSPILYAPASGSLDSSVAGFISKCSGAKATIIGNEKTISANTAAAIISAGAGGVSRLYGADRYATSSLICYTYRDRFAQGNIFLTTGADYPDALSGGAYAALLGAPVLLVGGTVATANADKLYSALDIEKAFILGGNSAVPVSTANAFIK